MTSALRLLPALFFCFTATTAVAGDRDDLVGTWEVKVFHDDGRDRLSRIGVSPPKKGREARVAKLVFTDKECYLIRGDGRREMASGLTNAGFNSCKLDESKTPRTIDIDGFAGKQNEKTKTYPGIYEIDGDKLRICYAETSSTRPSKFESDGHNNLFECERISEKPLPLPEKRAENRTKKPTGDVK